MAVGRAARSQRARRARPAADAEELAQTTEQGKKNPINNEREERNGSRSPESDKLEIAGKDIPVLICDDILTHDSLPLQPGPIEITEDEEPVFNSDIDVSDSGIEVFDSDIDVFEIYDKDVDLIDEENQIMAWCNDSDQSDSDAENSEEVVKFLWPISFSNNTPPQKRKLKSGRSGYLLPIAHPDTDSKKCVSRKMPRSSKHNYKLQAIKAVGANNNVMANFLQRGKDQFKAASKDSGGKPNATLSESAAPTPPSSSTANNEEYNNRVNSMVDNYNAVPKKPACDENVLFEREFQELNAKPAIVASITAASASNRRLQIGKKKFTTSVSRAKRLRHQVRHVLQFKELYTNTQGKGAHKKTLLSDPKILETLQAWTAKQKPGSVSPRSFHEHAVNVVLPKHGHQAISLDTATQWMYKLGFRAQRHQKSIYFDGHEREDVVASRIKFLDDVARLRVFSKKYDGENCEIPVMVDPEILGNNKETVFIYHDESTIHAKERPTLSWLLPGLTELRLKSLGRLMHISDFILESTGRLVLSPDEQEFHQLNCSDAATVIYPGSQGDAWWDMAQLCKQVTEKALLIFEALHPGCQGVFVFDCSSAHEAFGPQALRVQNMNLGPGGKQSRLRDTIIPTDDTRIPEGLRGQPQSMCFPTDYEVQSLAGQPKGIQQVLAERGLFQYYCGAQNDAQLPPLRLKCKQCSASGAVKDAEARARNAVKQAEARGYSIDQESCFREELGTTTSASALPLKLKDCCWSQIMANQSDFLAERPLLQTIIKEAGHVCLFLPKFHCELNPIELLWAYIKADYRRQSRRFSIWKDYKALFETARHACPLSTIRKFFRKIDWQHSAYKLGLTGPAAQRAMRKYSSHPRIPKDALKDVFVVGFARLESKCNPDPSPQPDEELIEQVLSLFKDAATTLEERILNAIQRLLTTPHYVLGDLSLSLSLAGLQNEPQSQLKLLLKSQTELEYISCMASTFSLLQSVRKPCLHQADSMISTSND
ncbi:hypothetical protein PSTG_06201 [Puccinia striiformis f. sp. tritici PST-78]|uniref:Tc1-like transposase DDE domain-containing protein n=1 Tax=Puccinia striiformis f. sp. tritici PST-78 TaxID=1165861 RepID=A0A0L0VMT3_9BASI|nr:hypothetical protein PSTG_06201 [Puccinia striiformis f. sp. tritici PST-78]